MKDLLAKIEAPHPLGLPAMMALPQNLSALSLEDKKKAALHYVKSAMELVSSNKVEIIKDEINNVTYRNLDVPVAEKDEKLELTSAEKVNVLRWHVLALSLYNDVDTVRDAEFAVIKETLVAAGLNDMDYDAAYKDMAATIASGVMSKAYADHSAMVGSLRYFESTVTPEVKRLLLLAISCIISCAEPTPSVRKMAITANLM